MCSFRYACKTSSLYQQCMRVDDKGNLKYLPLPGLVFLLNKLLRCDSCALRDLGGLCLECRHCRARSAHSSQTQMETSHDHIRLL
jgi:hypothetical protein